MWTKIGQIVPTRISTTKAGGANGGSADIVVPTMTEMSLNAKVADGRQVMLSQGEQVNACPDNLLSGYFVLMELMLHPHTTGQAWGCHV